MARILQKDAAILRKKALPVAPGDMGGKKIAGILERMREALEKEMDGVALAAPQIGVSLRLFIVSPRAFDINADASEPSRAPIPPDTELVYINPEITRKSREKDTLEEGCLSVRWLYGKVKRARKATVRACGTDGRYFERGASGLLAQIFQHEIDHLDGALFTDKATNIKEVLPEKEKSAERIFPHDS